MSTDAAATRERTFSGRTVHVLGVDDVLLGSLRAGDTASWSFEPSKRLKRPISQEEDRAIQAAMLRRHGRFA